MNEIPNVKINQEIVVLPADTSPKPTEIKTERERFGNIIDLRFLDMHVKDVFLAIEGGAECEHETNRKEDSETENSKSLPDTWFIRSRNKYGRIVKTFGSSTESELEAWVNAATNAVNFERLKYICDRREGKHERLGWTIFEGDCMSPEGTEFKKYDPEDFPQECITHHQENYESNYFSSRSYVYIDVLPFLIGRRFDAIAYSAIGILKPKFVRVTTGCTTLDSACGRVTVYINNTEDRIITKIKYETDVALPKGILNGNAWGKVVKNEIPVDYDTCIINSYALDKIDIQEK